jgi:pimeloyl-ACP methyl ester carboxylesterase
MVNKSRVNSFTGLCCCALFALPFVCRPADGQTFQVGLPPPEAVPSIPPGDDLIVYIHGGPSSRLEEASDLAPQLLAAGASVGTHYTVIAFDQPSQGYSQMLDPWAVAPPHSSSNQTLMVQFEEDVIVAFLQSLEQSVPGFKLSDHSVHFIGGSLGGALTLRMGHRPETWIKKLVSWNPASVWTSFGGDVLKGAALHATFLQAVEDEPDSRRKEYFDDAFGSEAETFGVQPNPEEWYRGNRGYSGVAGILGYGNSDTTQPFSAEWPCKSGYIEGSRIEQQEIYNQNFRRWHWRLGGELLLFSFFNTAWNQAPPDPGTGYIAGPTPNYRSLTKPTLLIASADDDWDEGQLLPVELGPSAGNHWENRWTRIQTMAPLMTETPGKALFLMGTGHSVHNERPKFLAKKITEFLTDSAPLAAPLAPQLPFVTEQQMTNATGTTEDAWCTPRTPVNSKASWPLTPGFQAPTSTFLDDAASAQWLGAFWPRDPWGNFPDGGSPGSHSLRAAAPLREFAWQPDPMADLRKAASELHDGHNDWGNAYADLAVSGGSAYAAFAALAPNAQRLGKAIGLVPGPQSDQWMRCLLQCEQCTTHVLGKSNMTPVTTCKKTADACGPSCMKTLPQAWVPALADPGWAAAINAALNRAYQDAYAIRRPDVADNFALRQRLAWIAVSGEDDSPTRPVNVPSGIPVSDAKGISFLNRVYPQFDAQVTVNTQNMTTCPAGSASPCTPSPIPITVRIRYTIASLPPFAIPRQAQ